MINFAKIFFSITDIIDQKNVSVIKFKSCQTSFLHNFKRNVIQLRHIFSGEGVHNYLGNLMDKIDKKQVSY